MSASVVPFIVENCSSVETGTEVVADSACVAVKDSVVVRSELIISIDVEEPIIVVVEGKVVLWLVKDNSVLRFVSVEASIVDSKSSVEIGTEVVTGSVCVSVVKDTVVV